MNTTNNKIAEQSRRRLTDGLLAVMEVYDFREITVTQIAQEAGLSRKTFYRLFSDKDEVLDCLFERLWQDCVAQLKANNVRHYWDVVQLYFDFCQKHRDLLLLLRKNGVLGRFFEASYEHSMAVFEYVRSSETAATLAAPLPYLLAYSIGGMNSMLLKWVENDMELPSSELISKLRAGFMSSDI